MEHVTRLRVRFGETDKMGVIYHANFLVYFELGRTEFMRARGLPYSEMERSGYRLVVVETGCRHRGNASYDDELTVRTRLAEVGHARVRFEYTVEGPGARVIAEGFTVLAALNPEGRPSRLPQELSRALRPV